MHKNVSVYDKNAHETYANRVITNQLLCDQIFSSLNNSIYINLHFFLDILPRNYMNLRKSLQKKLQKVCFLLRLGLPSIILCFYLSLYNLLKSHTYIVWPYERSKRHKRDYDCAWQCVFLSVCESIYFSIQHLDRMTWLLIYNSAKGPAEVTKPTRTP